MSTANRASLDCECGFWSFKNDDHVPFWSTSLMTIDAYLEYIKGFGHSYDKTNGGFGFGYGHLEKLAGERYGWYNKSGELVAYDAGADWSHLGLEKHVVIKYAHVPEGDRYRWRRLSCPFCGLTYAGWYRLQPYTCEKGRNYEIYDTSFFYSFSEEPDVKDKAEERYSWKPGEVREMIHYWKRHRKDPNGRGLLV